MPGKGGELSRKKPSESESVTQLLSNCLRPHRQEYWSGLPFPSPGDLPNPVIEQVVMFSLLFLLLSSFELFLNIFQCSLLIHLLCFAISLCVVFLVVSLGTTIHILNLSQST